MKIAFFGSSILSCYWNGAATYYRGLLRSVSELGYDITFYEPDAYGRQQHRDVESLPWVQSIVFDGEDRRQLDECLSNAAESDVIVKASGVGVFDGYLEERIASFSDRLLTVFWDVDAPATLDRVLTNPADSFRRQIPLYHAVFTYGGGGRVVDTYRLLGAKQCVPVYNAVDTDTHFPAEARPEYGSLLAFQGNRLPDRERRVEEFFLKPAALMPQETFLLGGSGWGDKRMPANVQYVGHVGTDAHNAFNSSSRFVLNVNRDSMASYGFSPPTRVFEAAASGAAIITDDWEGIELFLEPGKEILVARSGEEVARLLAETSAREARRIGSAARARILAEHTYRHRATQVDGLLRGLSGRFPKPEAAKVFA